MRFVVENLRELGIQAESTLKESYGVNAVEGQLLEMLQLLKSNTKFKSEFVQVLLEFLDEGNAPYEVVQFCMRELQWPEIKQHAQNMLESSDDPRVHKVANEVLAVYGEAWEDEDLFSYYSKD
ncbi:MAG: hypothetical protein ABW168_10075 [Sedimenticola sp.]